MAKPKTRSRAEREKAVIKNLDWLRANDPDKFAGLMRVLAQLVAKNQKATS